MQKISIQNYDNVSKALHSIRIILLLCIYFTVYTKHQHIIPFKMHIYCGMFLLIVMIVSIIWRLHKGFLTLNDYKIKFIKNIKYTILFLMYTVLFVGICIGPLYYFAKYEMIQEFSMRVIHVPYSAFLKVAYFAHKVLLFYILQALITTHILVTVIHIIKTKNSSILTRIFFTHKKTKK